MKNLFKNKNILITGGTGSVGREILRILLKSKPRVIRILDVDETREFELQQLYKNYDNLRFLLGDVRDKERLYRAIEDVDIVFHAAALKHVIACEYNPFEAVKTNVIGTQNIIDVAMDEEVEKVLLMSSDKAVNPYNVMGASKLLAEKLVVAANYYKGRRETVFACLRFGNILGSDGSVVPLFKNQIRNGGPVTLTDARMTRFVISLKDAIKLVFKSVELAQGGEIFISKMPVIRILDLAEVLIEELGPRYGYDPAKIKINIIGNKPGEKLYEELMTDEEAKRSLETEDLFIVFPELKELFPFDLSKYPDAKSAKFKSYKSKDIKPLSKRRIRSLLKNERLLE
jgi:FlaA1/EpsC-like NDP-sugar epimerase